MQDSASAPASSAARASTAMSVTLGESFGITGRRVALRTAATTSWVIRGSPPKAMPPFFTLGQEMLTSRPAMPAAPSQTRATSAYSSTVSPQTLTRCTVSWRATRGSDVAHEGADADALQPDGVEETRGGLRDAGGGVAVPRLHVEALGDEPAEPGEVEEVLVLDAVAEGARGRDQGVLEAEPGDLDREVHAPAPVAARRAREASSPGHRTRAASKTGPSVHAQR